MVVDDSVKDFSVMGWGLVMVAGLGVDGVRFIGEIAGLFFG